MKRSFQKWEKKWNILFSFLCFSILPIASCACTTVDSQQMGYDFVTFLMKACSEYLWKEHPCRPLSSRGLSLCTGVSSSVRGGSHILPVHPCPSPVWATHYLRTRQRDVQEALGYSRRATGRLKLGQKDAESHERVTTGRQKKQISTN